MAALEVGLDEVGQESKEGNRKGRGGKNLQSRS